LNRILNALFLGWQNPKIPILIGEQIGQEGHVDFQTISLKETILFC
jgi:hypothetical protein